MFPLVYTACLISADLFFGSSPAKVKPPRPAAAKAAPHKLRQVTYQVADLVNPIPEYDLPDQEFSKLLQPRPSGPLNRHVRGTCEDQLIKLITTTITPDSWEDRGGKGTVQYYPVGGGLVIQQTRQVHGEIRKLLTDLRRLQETEIRLDLRLAVVPAELAPGEEEQFERIGIDFSEPGPPRRIGGTGQTGQGRGQVRAFLNDRQVYQLLDAIQGDRRAYTWMMPRVTTFHGQRAFVNFSEQKYFLTRMECINQDGQIVFRPHNEPVRVGTLAVSRCTASADRRFVSLDLYFSKTDIVAPVPMVPLQVLSKGAEGEPFQVFLQQPSIRRVAVEQSLVIADGKTAVLDCGTAKAEVPSDDSWGGTLRQQLVRLLAGEADSAGGEYRMLLLVTPRIVVNEEEGQVSLGAGAPRP